MEKKQILEKAKKQDSLFQNMKSAKSVVFVDFRGISVADDTKLRKTMRESQVHYGVIKNTLAARAADQIGWKNVSSMFHGPTAMAVSLVDPASGPRVLAGIAKDIPAIKVKGGVLEGGELLTVERVTFLATLPSRQELLATVAGTIKAPITSVAFVLNATLTGFARAVNALREQREQQAAD